MRILATLTTLKQTSQMAIKSFRRKNLGACLFVVFGLGTFSLNVSAIPIVTYTVSGTSGNYTLDFTVNNTGTLGFDLYLFTVLADGNISGAPAGYNASSYNTVHYWDIGGTQNGPFNNSWIDPTYTVLPTGRTLSGFTVNVSDLIAPTSIVYSAFGEDNGMIYTGPGNLNTGNPSNPFFTGSATESVPDTSITVVLFGLTAIALMMWKKIHQNAG
jgi:hypothetical protein